MHHAHRTTLRPRTHLEHTESDCHTEEDVGITPVQAIQLTGTALVKQAEKRQNNHRKYQNPWQLMNYGGFSLVSLPTGAIPGYSKGIYKMITFNFENPESEKVNKQQVCCNGLLGPRQRNWPLCAVIVFGHRTYPNVCEVN